MAGDLPGATRDPWIQWLAQFATISAAIYLVISGLTFELGDATWLNLDARWVYVASGALGIGAAFVRRLRFPWLIAFMLCTLGRSAILLFDGSDDIASRSAELRAAVGWFVLWILGSFPMFATQASDIIRGRIEPRAR